VQDVPGVVEGFEVRISARRWRISLRVNGIRPLSGGGGGSLAVITDRNAWARMARAVQRCQEVPMLQRRPATRTRALSVTGVKYRV
jgi:hypothetical protein